jgi:hypothetical protein
MAGDITISTRNVFHQHSVLEYDYNNYQQHI